MAIMGDKQLDVGMGGVVVAAAQGEGERSGASDAVAVAVAVGVDQHFAATGSDHGSVVVAARFDGFGADGQVGGPVVMRDDGMQKHHRAGYQHGNKRDVSASLHLLGNPKVRSQRYGFYFDLRDEVSFRGVG